jgi:hypothetical protein
VRAADTGEFDMLATLCGAGEPCSLRRTGPVGLLRKFTQAM